MTYLEEVKEDVIEYIKNEIDFSHYEDLDELEDFLNDELFIEDSVTGNASGSYYFNSYRAEEKVKSEIETVLTAYEEFDELEEFAKHLNRGEWETMDVITRCYLLYQAVYEVIEELKEMSELEEIF